MPVRWVVPLVVLLLAGGGTTPVAQADGDEPVPSRTLFDFRGDDVFESSGLVDRGRVVYTVNDSGDDAVVYGVDSRTGRTVSETTYAEGATDVEALAPGADGTVWVGDTGDNQMHRDDVQVTRVRPRDGDRPGDRYDLAYPDGPHDAETLLVEPSSQRVFVVSKSAFGGTVYAAPRPLQAGAVNRLRPFARVSGLVTDGAFFPDGRHVVLRSYGTATVYTFPGFDRTGTVRLPSQQQGEAVSVSPTGRVLISSEGVHAPVLSVELPARLTTAGAVPVPSRSNGTSTPTTSPPGGEAGPGAERRDTGDWVGIGLVALVIVGLVGVVLRSAPRSRGDPR